MYASVPMIELGNPPPNPPEVWNVTGIATGDFTTRSPARSPARFSTAACPWKIPPFGEETTVVNPPLRQVSMRLSLRLASSPRFATEWSTAGPQDRAHPLVGDADRLRRSL